MKNSHKKVYNLYPSSNVIKTIKSSSRTNVRVMRNQYKILVGQPDGEILGDFCRNRPNKKMDLKGEC
jgi:hypothetical protein